MWWVEAGRWIRDYRKEYFDECLEHACLAEHLVLEHEVQEVLNGVPALVDGFRGGSAEEVGLGEGWESVFEVELEFWRFLKILRFLKSHKF